MSLTRDMKAGAMGRSKRDAGVVRCISRRRFQIKYLAEKQEQVDEVGVITK